MPARRKAESLVTSDFSDLPDCEQWLEEFKLPEEMYRTVLENSAVAITVTNELEDIVFWNRAAESLLGMNKAMESAAPLPAAALRIPFTTVLFLLMATARGDVRTNRLQRQDIKALVTSGIFVGLSALLFTVAIKWGSAGNVAILVSTSPLFVVPLAYFVLKERMTRGVLLGTAICMVGIWLTMW